MTWVPLTLRSQYSVLRSTSSIEGLVEAGKAMSLPAMALTDHGNLFGAVDFYKAAKGAGIKPIIGCHLYEAPESRLLKERIAGKQTHYPITLIVKDAVGYKNLCILSSAGYVEGFYHVPRIDRELLAKHTEGLICIAGALYSRLAFAALTGSQEKLLEELRFYQKLYGEDFYLQLQRHRMSESDLEKDGIYQESWLVQKYQEETKQQELVNERLVALAKAEGIPYVATQECLYLEREDWKAHEVLLNVQSGEPVELWEKDSFGQPKFRTPNPKRVAYASHEHYFKSPAQMEELFKDYPEALSTTQEVYKKCSFELDTKTKHYPVFTPPALEGKTVGAEERNEAVAAYLKELCVAGIEERYTEARLQKVREIYPGKDPLQVVKDRLDYELSVIAPKGLCDYLLIVWDILYQAKAIGIPVGPGRGSGAGSIICYLIGITDVEPLRFHLFFERFINPERVSYPDIDVDICMDRRGEVIRYILDKYGKDNVAQIITFGTMKAKSAIRDVGRVLNIPLAKVNAIAKLVPEELNITIEKALEVDVDLARSYQEDDDARRIVDMARILEGSIRSTGTHAAGMIICGDCLTKHIPITLAKDSDMPVTQYAMKPVEAVGMLKVDLLGLKTLTAIQLCVDALKEHRGIDVDWRNLPLEDSKTFELLGQGRTLGVFQLESGGMADLCRNLRMDKFEEIIAAVSLYRPGPMTMIPSFTARKLGREPIEYDHPWLEGILKETYGIMVYQEQVMQIAGKVANYSLGEGDMLRRAMGKKDKEEMERQRDKFCKGAGINGLDNPLATKIFDQMEKFAGYGFNKSHATAYGYIAYVTAYLKSHYPREWMAALMTCDSADLSKVARFIGEAQSMGIEILPPDVNESSGQFVATPKGIRFAMSAVKGVGEGIVEEIVRERKKGGNFTSLYQFFCRCESKKVGKKAVENLIEAGAFDFTGWSRDALRLTVEPAFEAAASEQKDAASGAMTIFALLGPNNEGRFAAPPPVARPTPKLELLLKEKELLGFFLTGHPLKLFEPTLKRLSCVPLAAVPTLDEGTVFRCAFLIENHAVRIASKSGKKFAIMTISDGLVRFELPIWPELYEDKGELIRDNKLLYAVLQVEVKEGERRLNCNWIGDLTQCNEAMVQQCDNAFDRARLMAERFRKKGSDVEKKDKKEEKKNGTADFAKKNPEPPKKVQLSCDLRNLKMSEIISFKELVHECGGNQPLQLTFLYEKQEIAHLHIDTTQGVTDGELFRKGLEKIGKFML